jgi:multidrug efflux pump subunit AcrA (membrane-fusion protein)
MGLYFYISRLTSRQTAELEAARAALERATAQLQTVEKAKHNLFLVRLLYLCTLSLTCHRRSKKARRRS